MRKNNLTLIAIAILVGLSFGLPHILMSALLGGYASYTPLVISNVSGQSWDETFGYAPRFREVFDGRLLIGDVNTYEYKSKPSPAPVFPALLLGLFARFLGSVKALFVWSDFIFPAAVFILAFLFLQRATKNMLISLTGSLGLMYGNRLIVGIPPLPLWRLKWLIESIFNYNYGVCMLEFARLDIPQFTFIPFISALYLLLRALQERKIKPAIICGVFFGILFYSYLYYWAFFMAGCCLLLLLYLVRKDKPKSKILFTVILTGLLISLPYWINSLKFRMLPGADDFLLRTFTEFGRKPYVPVVYVFWLILFIGFYRKRDDIFFFFASFFVAGLLCMNIQLITGFNVLISHWELRVLNPWQVFMATIILSNLISQNSKNAFLKGSGVFARKTYKPLCLFFAIFFISYGLYTHTRFSFKQYKNYTLTEENKILFEWLNNNTPNDSVVVSCSIERNSLIPAYTHNNIFLPGPTSLAPDSEILDRLFITYGIFGIDENYLRFVIGDAANNQETDFPKLEFSVISHLFNGEYLVHGKAKTPVHMPEETQERILDDFRKQGRLEKSSLSRYRIDYVILGGLERQIAKQTDLSRFFKKVFEFKGLLIYQLQI